MTVRRSILALLLSVCTCTVFAQEPEPPGARRITLREAVDLALARNHAVRLARLSVDEKDRAKDVAKSAYFPQVRNETTLVHLTDTQLIQIPAGGLGVVGVNAGAAARADPQSGRRECREQWNRHRAAADAAFQSEGEPTTSQAPRQRPRAERRAALKTRQR